MTDKNQRSCNLDLLRIFAFLTVASIHFFWSGELYGQKVNTPYFLLPICIRNFSMICVPLFLMLSGYLLKDRTPSKRYYCKLFHVLGIYLLASFACAFAKFLFDRENFSVFWAIKGIFSFETAPYSWYVDMYVGLFLLIPFFNLAYNHCPPKWKKILIASVLILTVLPSLTNIWRPWDLSWWKHPGSSGEYLPLASEYWEGVYAITFYFLGAYLRDHPPKRKPIGLFLMAVGVCILGGVFSYYRCYGYGFVSGKWTAYQSILTTTQAVLVFRFFCSLDLSSVGQGSRKVFAKLSSWVLGAYLCSSIFDDLFYPKLLEARPVFLERFLFYPVMVAAVAICSMVLSALLTEFYNLCEKLVVKCISKRASCKKSSPEELDS